MDYQNITISEIVTQDFRTSEVFRKHDIDFCCGGQIALDVVCKQKSLDLDQIIYELNVFEQTKSGTEHIYDDWEIDFLADFILNTHHRYVKSEIPVLRAYLEKIADVHGENHPELRIVKNLFFESADALLRHMEKEEVILFPYIKELLQFQKQPENMENPVIDPSENPLNEMMDEHVTEGARFREMARLTNNYMIPGDACNTYLVAIRKLEAFERDLHRHIHLENNILFPKTLLLEKVILS
ncbi:MAG: iron-sulfur cluster repair di-iron protein [Bacteroidales bacterium]|nr:iron-sulfur cluster repair di-iron protein [Bacteroidales bacterium]